ncbi:Uncharacterised protein [Vibrio cholerae]|nr:Uncharacterised protein [Vibrio cholerae]CSI35679.1 Uncharacterised protein [Vibrio cholerae]
MALTGKHRLGDANDRRGHVTGATGLNLSCQRDP